MKYAASKEFLSTQHFVATDFSFTDLMHFLENHYVSWGGRVAAFFFLCILLKYPPLLFAILQTCLSVFIIVYFTRKESFNKSAIYSFLITFLILIIPLSIFRDGIMWMTSSILYYWGSLIMVFVLYRLIEAPEKISTLILILFVSAWHESIGMAMFGSVFLLMVFHHKHALWKRILTILISLSGICFLLFAPGNFMRMSHSTNTDFYKRNFTERSIERLDDLLSHFITIQRETLLLYSIIGVGVIFIVGAQYLKTKKQSLLIIGLCYSLLLVLLITIAYNQEYFSHAIELISFSLYLIFSTGIVLYQYIKTKEALLTISFLATLILFFTGILSPFIAARMLTPHYIMAIFFLSLSLQSFFRVYELNTNWLYAMTCIVALVVTPKIIYRIEGYQKNYAINQKNHQLLLNASTQKKDVIVLEKPMDEFINAPIEQTSYQFHWMKPFYSLDSEAIIKVKK